MVRSCLPFTRLQLPWQRSEWIGIDEKVSQEIATIRNISCVTRLCRPNRSIPGCIPPIVEHSLTCVTLIELGADFVDVGESEGSPG
jgi:hypothetical protein